MKTIGKYEIQEELGRGGMGVVYKAYDSLMDRPVAIKVILEKALEIPEIKARFFREARTAGKLSHDNITIVHDMGEADGKAYIVMEYLRGRDLRSIIDNKEPLTLQQKIDYAKQTCRGLQYAHANNVVHRDIKPENIKILEDGRVKIIDFGIAKPYVGAATAAQIDTDPVLTRVGMRIGTPWYMSPEQVKGQPVDKRSDIFSFGVLFYELLTYKKPFEGDDTTVMYKILHEEPETIHLEGSGLVNELQVILSKCLEKNLDARYGDCSELLNDLNAIPDKAQQERIIKELLTEGQALVERKRFNEATLKLNEILQLDPNHPEANSLLKKLPEGDKESATIKVLTGRITGDVISHFQIIERIGGGGMGVVYKAEDITLKRMVALKFLVPDMTRDAAAKKRFLKEAQAASALDHPNICTIHEISETDDGLIFICMAYYGGENLSTRISKGPFEILQFLDVVTKIAKGLAKAHEHGIVHRDIKPANIIITGSGEVKIVDFGLAKLSGGTRITKVGSTMGTLPYMSPEQVRGFELDHRTDIWSYGVLLYELLTGQLPFKGDYEAAVLYSIVNEDPVPASKLRPDIPLEVDEIISKALKKEVKERYASMQVLLDDLERIQWHLSRSRNQEFARGAELARFIENGKIYLGKKQYGDALARFEAALKLAPGNLEVLELRDQCRRKQEELLQLNKALGEGKGYFEKGKYKEALSVFMGVISQDPNHNEANDYIAKIQKLGEHSERIDKSLTDADFYLRHDRFEQALETYKRVLEIEPDHKDAVKGLKRAEKGLEQRGSTTRVMTPVPSKKASSKTLWYILAGVLVGLLAVGTWLFLRESEQPSKEAKEVAKPELLEPASAARQRMLNQKQEAQQAEGEKGAPATYKLALEAEQKGNTEFDEGDYAAAKQTFGDAGDLFAKSVDEAKKNAAASESDLSKLNAIVKSLKDDVHREKVAAERSGGKKLAADLFEKAIAREQEGDRNFQLGTREGYLSAQQHYVDARDAYKRASAQLIAAGKLKDDAAERRGEANDVRQRVPGTDKDKKANANYAKALDLEAAGARQFQNGDFAAAGSSFAQAKDFYAQANSEIAASLRNTKAPDTENREAEKREAEKKEAERRETEKREAALRDINGIIAKYKDSFERADVQTLKSLLKFNDDETRNWSEFFKNADDIKANIETRSVDINGNNANVKLQVRLSFTNKTKGETQKSDFPQNWVLEGANGKWEVVSRK